MTTILIVSEPSDRLLTPRVTVILYRPEETPAGNVKVAERSVTEVIVHSKTTDGSELRVRMILSLSANPLPVNVISPLTDASMLDGIETPVITDRKSVV